jgi:hypothetical protein
VVTKAVERSFSGALALSPLCTDSAAAIFAKMGNIQLADYEQMQQVTFLA